MVDLIQCIYPRVQSLSEQGMLQCLYQYPSKTAFCLESFVGDDKETIDKLTTYLKDSARLDGTELIYQHQSLKAHHKVIRFACKFGKTQNVCHHNESFFSDGKMQMNNTILAREHRAHSSKNNSSSSKNKLSLLPGKELSPQLLKKKAMVNLKDKVTKLKAIDHHVLTMLVNLHLVFFVIKLHLLI